MAGSVITRLRFPLVVIAVVVLQTSAIPHMRVVGVMPDAMLLLAIAGGLTGGPARGAAVGFCSGMAIDLFLQTPFGLSALTFSLAGYGVGSLGEAVARPVWWTRLLTVAAGSAAGEVIFAVAGAVVGQAHLLEPRLGVVVGIVTAFNVVLGPFAWRLLDWALPGGLADRPSAPDDRVGGVASLGRGRVASR